jgi:hypothetical protein
LALWRYDPLKGHYVSTCPLDIGIHQKQISGPGHNQGCDLGLRGGAGHAECKTADTPAERSQSQAHYAAGLVPSCWRTKLSGRLGRG